MQQKSLTTTLKTQSWQLPLYHQPHLHVTSGDEALVLDVTHLEELVGFLQDSVLSHVPILTFTRLFSASLPLPFSSGHRAGRSIGGDTRSSKSCHGICESVDMKRRFLRPSHEPGKDRGVEGRDPGEVELRAALHQRLSPMSLIVIS